MPQFPNTEPTIAALANTIESGLASDPIFAKPPVLPAQLDAALSDFNSASALADQKRAEAQQATDAKSATLALLVSQMKTVLDWASKLPGVTEAQLRKIGWGFASPPTLLTAPGQCRDLELVRVVGNSLEFDWKKPVDGGKPSGYKLYRRAAGSSGAWTLEDAIFGISQTRDEEHDFPPGQWEVVVTATNNAGEGPHSNTVSVVVA
jgi:hypothetical protein